MVSTIKGDPCMYVCLFCLFVCLVGWLVGSLFREFLVFLRCSRCETSFSMNRRGIHVRHSMIFQPMGIACISDKGSYVHHIRLL
jgi:hypothetical protein